MTKLDREDSGTGMFDLKKAENDAVELWHLMLVINNRLDSMMDNDPYRLTTDGELWDKLSTQLKEAYMLANAVKRNCRNTQP